MRSPHDSSKPGCNNPSITKALCHPRWFAPSSFSFCPFLCSWRAPPRKLSRPSKGQHLHGMGVQKGQTCYSWDDCAYLSLEISISKIYIYIYICVCVCLPLSLSLWIHDWKLFVQDTWEQQNKCDMPSASPWTTKAPHLGLAPSGTGWEGLPSHPCMPGPRPLGPRPATDLGKEVLSHVIPLSPTVLEALRGIWVQVCWGKWIWAYDNDIGISCFDMRLYASWACGCQCLWRNIHWKTRPNSHYFIPWHIDASFMFNLRPPKKDQTQTLVILNQECGFPLSPHPQKTPTTRPFPHPFSRLWSNQGIKNAWWVKAIRTVQRSRPHQSLDFGISLAGFH